jgi:Ig-like domain CHU_C associated/Secretion system C-terminal sorting domain
MKKNYFKFFAVLFALIVSLIIMPSCNHKNESAYEQNESEEEENDEYDGPAKAAEFEFNRMKDPATGTVSSLKMWQAVLETENQKNTNSYSNSSANALAPLAWVERGSNSDVAGPQGNQRPGNGVTSGRMRTLWVDLGDATGKTVWVGGISGGLWKTSDITAAPATWTLINDYLSNLAVSGIAQDPSNPNNMYFCTGESYFTGGGVGGVGVFKSTDHGISWSLLASSAAFVRCTRIQCDAVGNVYVSTLGIGATIGLNRSKDGGATWLNISPFEAAGVTQTSRIPDFEISSTGRMHVIGGFSSATSTLGGYRYTDNPAAATPVWQTATTMFTWPFGTDARTELATVGNTIYASLGMAAVGTAGGKIEKVAKSTDGGNNWTTADLTATNISDLNGGGQGGYSNGITIDPSNTNNVIIGSLRLLKSTDGGLTFSKISEWVGTTGQYVHADIHNMAWYDNGNKLLVCTDGGLFYSANKGTNFSDKNIGLRLKQFYGVSMHPTSTNYFLAGAQDNGTHQFNGAGLTSSIEVLGGDGGITAIDQDEPLFQTGTYVYANFRRSTNGGSTWSSSGSSSSSGQFIDPYDFDNLGNKVYAGYDGQQYLRWEDPHTGFTFTPITVTAFGTLPSPNTAILAKVASVTVSPYTPNRVYFGLDNGKVFRIDDATEAIPTVTEITPAGTAAGYVNSVVIGTSDQDITVTLANAFAAATTSIWSTTNGGTSWTAIDGNLPEMPVYWGLYHPDGDTKMYIATETGVWSTDLINGTSTIWTAETTFPTVKTSMLKYRASDRTIAAATYGRGLWTATIPNTNCTPASVSTQPLNTTVCAGNNTSMSITAAGTPTLTYQWQLSTAGAGGPWNNITANATYSNVTTATLNITAANVSMNTSQYRCVVTGNCAPLTANSNPAILTVNDVPPAPTVTATVIYCQGATATALTATGTSLLWYTSITGGTGSATAPTPSTTATGNTIYYVSQTASTCESPRAAITVTVNSTPAAPVVTSPVAYCQGAIATALTATGTNLKWYTVASGGTALAGAPTPLTTTVGSTTYYVSQTTGTCEGPRAAIVVTITATPAAPTVASPLTYCQGVTASALTATGTNLLWYTAATGGTGSVTAPTPSTATAGSTTYYVSQTTGCESPRAAIIVNVTAAPIAPTVTANVVYCQFSTATTLTATGTGLLWYTTATGGIGSATAPTPSTTTIGTTTYYVSQTVSSCESPRVSITVTVNETPTAPTVNSPVNYCQGATASILTVSGITPPTLVQQWYTVPTGGTALSGAPTPSTATLGSTIYYVSFVTFSTPSCEGPRAAITVNVTALPAAPTVTSPLTYCQGTAATALTATGINLLWYTAPTGGTGSATAPTPSTATAGSTTFYVSQTTGCEGPRAAIVVTVIAGTPSPTVSTPIAYCQGATATTLTATGTNLLWYTTATGGASSAIAPTPSTTTAGTTVYYVSQTSGTCESPRAAITVNVTATPAAPIVTSPVSYCQNATATALTATGTNLKWYTVATGGTALAGAPTPLTTTIGSTIYYVSQSTGTCEGPRAAITVNVVAVTAAPTVTTPVVYCQGATATALTATGTSLLWYTVATGGTGSATAPTPSTATVGSTTYYVSQTSGCGESARTPIVVTINVTPAAPTVTTIAYCQNATSTALTATGTNLLWYTAAVGGSGNATAPTPSTTTVGSTIYYVSQTTGTCEGPRAALTVNVTATPAAPIITTPVSYCQGATTTTLTATGTNLLWYSTATGGIGSVAAPTPLSTTIGSTIYYVSQSAGTCEGPRAIITVNVVAVTPAPTATTPIVYCQGATATALTATGTSLLWYTVATGGTGSATAPTPSTSTVGSTTYYVSQTSGCGESARTPIVVTINVTPVAPTVSAVTYCQNATATALTATGTNLLWYASATGGTGTATAPTPSTATVGSVTYYVSQTTGTCEGPRAAIVVNVLALPSAPTVTTPLTYCQNATATALTATGTNLKWYTVATGGTALATAPTPVTTTIGSTTFYVSQTTGTCEGSRAAIVVNVTATTAAPTATSPIAYCQGSTATALTATGTNLLWYTAATGGTGSATAPTPTTTTVGSISYYVSQTGTCESVRTAIVVNVTSTPTAPTATTPIGYCQGSPSTLLAATGTSLLWYTAATGGTGSATAPTPLTTTAGSTTYYVSQSTGTCEGPRAAIVVNVSAAPSITTQPQDITSCTTTATFTVAATGTSLTYQWFLSTDAGTTYSAIAGATSSTLVVNGLTAAQSNYKYRVVVSSGTCTVATSNSVTAKVGTNPVVVLTSSPVVYFNPYTNGGLYATVSPTGNYTYQWKRNTNLLTNTGTSITKANGLLDDFGNYQVIVTDIATGCAGLSNVVLVGDIEGTRSQLFVSPNPTTGLVKVSFYNNSIISKAYSINICDERGARVMIKDLSLAGRYGSANIDFSKLPSGNYVVIIRDADGKKLATNKVIKY